MRPSVINELNLYSHGLKLFRRPISSITVTKNKGEYLLMNSDSTFCKQEIAKFSKRDSFAFDRKITPKESFKSFLDLKCNFGDFKEAIDYFLQLQNLNIGLTEDLPYVELLQSIFQFTNGDSIVNERANSFVLVFDTPDFLKIIPGISSRTVMKSSKFKDDLIICTQRELEIMEKFRKYEPFAYYYTYFRVQDQLYLFMEHYPTDLDNVFQNQEMFDRHVKDLCCQLAFAIRLLHKHQILHRDLKPSNLFLSNEDLDKAQLNIADFDHSTTITDNNTESCNQFFTGLTSSTNYEPSETGNADYSYTSDIWQIGMIFYQRANQGEYPIKNAPKSWNEEIYQEECSYDKIKENLADKRVEDDFIQLISDYQILTLLQIVLKSVLKTFNLIMRKHCRALTFGQLLSKSQPLQFTKSGKL